MDLVSYRGPLAEGGLSSALRAVWEDPRILSVGGWWHISDSSIQRMYAGSQFGITMPCSAEDIQGHYRFSNEFLWPCLHGMPELAKYSPLDHLKFQRVSQQFAERLNDRHSVLKDDYFIHDYHFCLMPRIMTAPFSFFWHTPWSQPSDSEWSSFLKRVAIDALAAERIGFQTAAHADNFLRYLDSDLMDLAESKILVAPVGIDWENWQCLSELTDQTEPQLVHTRAAKIVLSVDRSDYSKAVLERINAIRQFLHHHPEWHARVRFIQVLTGTRSQLRLNEEYADACEAAIMRVNEEFRTMAWLPIELIKEHQPPALLAKLYRRADVMLITSRSDGLNLTAKEFIACQPNQNAGSLILSYTTGVWDELKPFPLVAHCSKTNDIAEKIHTALTSPGGERDRKMDALKKIVRANSSMDWIEKFATKGQPVSRTSSV
jgi:trehalose-6-phosphate synthase